MKYDFNQIIAETLLITAACLTGFVIVANAYNAGYINGLNFPSLRLTTYVRRRIIKEGNVIKVPFRDESDDAKPTPN